MSMEDESMGGLKIGRRQLLKRSTAVVAVATMAPVALFSGRTAHAAGDFTQASLNLQVGGFFQVDAGPGGWNDLELVEVSGEGGAAELDQFTARFRGSPNAEFSEGVYDVVPPEGDAYSLHFQPAGSDEGGVYYDAAFAVFKPVTPSCAAPA